jgi:hypothetical protein
MSPRTAKYVVAMVREDFDYDAWLKKVREEDAQAKRAEATGSSGEEAAGGINKPISKPDDQYSRSTPPLPLVPKTIRVPRVLGQPYHQSKSQTPKARLRRWLEKIHRAWGKFQESRRRDAVYIVLGRVFEIVLHYKVRRRTTRLLRHAFKFANLPFDKNADPYTAVIRCTCDSSLDAKIVSKWARALRFVAAAKKSRTPLKRFMKEIGGINACASLYAELRVMDRKKHLGETFRSKTSATNYRGLHPLHTLHNFHSKKIKHSIEKENDSKGCGVAR